MKLAKMTMFAVNMILGISIFNNRPEMGFSWLKLSYATLILLKYFNFISKNVDLEACFLCFRSFHGLKQAKFYSKFKIFIIKVVLDFL